MAKEGSVAPKERINVTFKPATGGAQEEIELPLKLMVLGDFTQRADDRKIEDRKPISIDKNNFDEVLGKQELSLTFAVPNRLQDEETDDELPVQLRINSMKDFNPAAVVELRDLAANPHPVLDEAALGALFTPAEQRTPGQAARVALDDALIAQVQAADAIVLGVPMYNFGVPVQLICILWLFIRHYK